MPITRFHIVSGLKGIPGSASGIDRSLELAAEHRQPADVVAVFMRHQNGIQAGRIFPDRFESLFNPARRNPGVHQKTGPAQSDKNRVAARTTR